MCARECASVVCLYLCVLARSLNDLPFVRAVEGFLLSSPPPQQMSPENEGTSHYDGAGDLTAKPARRPPQPVSGELVCVYARACVFACVLVWAVVMTIVWFCPRSQLVHALHAGLSMTSAPEQPARDNNEFFTFLREPRILLIIAMSFFFGLGGACVHRGVYPVWGRVQGVRGERCETAVLLVLLSC